jgi:hypothetical protein
MPLTLRLRVLLIFMWPSFVEARKISQFLFVGQSNIEGNVVNDPGNLRFDQTMDILLSAGSDEQIHIELVEHFKTAVSSPPTPDFVYEFEAAELIRLRKAGLLTDSFQQPLPTVTCSFYQLDLQVDYDMPSREGKIIAHDANLSPYANCGRIFGPELMFGHVLQKYVYADDPFSIVKVAAGGSEIKSNWSKDNGSFWAELMENLVETIDTNTEMWKAIIWFQGENDSFDQAEAEGYLEELTKFISNLREEMFKVDVTAFSKPSDIPVVIVGLGCWIARDGPFGKIVSDAQRDFVASTDSAVFVHTDDLSCHYHFDDASQLIIGERLGKAMENFLVTPATNPSTLSSKKPTYRPTKAPLTSLSTQIVGTLSATTLVSDLYPTHSPTPRPYVRDTTHWNRGPRPLPRTVPEPT